MTRRVPFATPRKRFNWRVALYAGLGGAVLIVSVVALEIGIIALKAAVGAAAAGAILSTAGVLILAGIAGYLARGR